MIEIVTFTGVDEWTDHERVARITKAYPFAEFAVLAGSASGAHPRFPSLRTVTEWREFANRNRIRTAVHLCGKLGRAVRDNELVAAAGIAAGFGRVQVNVPGADRRKAAQNAARLVTLTGASIIVQHDQAWNAVPVEPEDNLEYLFDASGGRGIATFDRWPAPSAARRGRYGYAGGLGPENIERACSFAGGHHGARLWFDMESGVRSGADRLDLDKVEAVCARVETWRREHAGRGTAGPRSESGTTRGER